MKGKQGYVVSASCETCCIVTVMREDCVEKVQKKYCLLQNLYPQALKVDQFWTTKFSGISQAERRWNVSSALRFGSGMCLSKLISRILLTMSWDRVTVTFLVKAPTSCDTKFIRFSAPKNSIQLKALGHRRRTYFYTQYDPTNWKNSMSTYTAHVTLQ